MLDTVLSGRRLVEKLNQESWFDDRENSNSLIRGAEFIGGILSYAWAGFSDHDRSYYFTKAVDHGDGRITVFANVHFYLLNNEGTSGGVEERPVIVLYDICHFPELVRRELRLALKHQKEKK